jgi:DNA (cytosine-5)-methyltransferase 1
MERNNPTKRWTLLSLFAGAGGLDLGFRGGFTFLGKEYPRTAFDIVKAYDINPHAVATYNANLEPVCEVKDVTALDPNDLPKADVVLGGFPCQDFSLAGKRRGIGTPRGNLYKALVSAVEAVRPKVFVAENVKGLLTANGGLAVRVIADGFARAGPGYRVHVALLNAAHFGIPQRRERVFIVGVREDLEGEFLFPRPTHAPPLLADGVSLLPWVTARDALHDLEDDRHLKLLPNPEWSKARKNRGQGNRPIRADEPAPTIRAEHHGNIEFHYVLPRRLSVREAARLQSFPDTFAFHASMSEAYRLVGNAVPPVLAWHLAVAVQNFLEREASPEGVPEALSL